MKNLLLLLIFSFVLFACKKDNPPSNPPVQPTEPVTGKVKADFSYVESTNPGEIVFTNLSSGAVSYHWVLGDGSVSSLSHPTHTYNEVKTYTVRLTAKKANGESHTQAKTVQVTN